MDWVELERIADGAWPAREYVALGPWSLRVTGGPGRRVNSVFTATGEGISGEEMKDLVAQAEEVYEARGMRAAFQISAATGPVELDDYLAERGYGVDGVSEVWMAEVRGNGSDGVRLSDTCSEDWLECCVENAQKRAIHAAIISRITQSSCFAAVQREGVVVSCGLGVSDRKHLGIFCMATQESHRRKGYASSVLRGLMKWGKERGDERAYLQVMRENVAAQGLYGAHGFERAYGYHYRIAQ